MRPPSLVIWPYDVLKPGAATIGFDPQDAAPSLSLSGRMVVTGAGHGLWRPRYEDVVVHGARGREAAIGMQAAVMGRATPVMVRVPTMLHDPANGARGQSVRFSDGSSFSDGAGFEGDASDYRLAASVIAGTTRLQVSRRFGGPLKAGHLLSMGPHLYQVRSAPRQQFGAFEVVVAPEVRMAAPAGERLNTQRPWVKCRVVDPSVLSALYQPGPVARVSVDFIEDTTPGWPPEV